MELYDRRDNDLTIHLLPPSKTSNARNGLHLVESLAKDIPWNYLHQHHRLLPRLLVILLTLMVRLIAEDNTAERRPLVSSQALRPEIITQKLY